MYLREIYVRNSGPVLDFEYAIQVNREGIPRPLVLLGPNGSGKSTVLSVIADSFFEMASGPYVDVVPNANGLTRPWFRVIGPWTVTHGTSGGVAVLRFEDGNESRTYCEKSGELDTSLLADIPDHLKAAVDSISTNRDKAFPVTEDDTRRILNHTSLLYFPASRSELPHWLNESSINEQLFSASPRFANQLGRPIYIERGIEQLSQWIRSLLLDSRADFVAGVTTEGGSFGIATGDLLAKQADQAIWAALNSVLSTILADPAAHFVYGGRRATLTLGYAVADGRELPLESLSAGQSTLLTVFGTLVRYGDRTSTGALPPNIRAICVVDEIDTHLHVDQQSRALPALMAMFPQVQFIVSSHSPLFALGLEEIQRDDSKPVLLEMPLGIPIQAEAYTEFRDALEVLRKTSVFNRLLTEEVSANEERLLVLCEGETDPPYLRAAAEALGRESVTQGADLDWIGSIDPSGNVLNGGKDALNAAIRLFSAKPELVRRPLLLLFDNDTNKASTDLPSRIFVRSIPTNAKNKTVEAGIENLLPESLFTKDRYQTKEFKKPNGDITTLKQLRKSELCAEVCQQPIAENFEHFQDILSLIEDVLATVLSSAELRANNSGTASEI